MFNPLFVYYILLPIVAGEADAELLEHFFINSRKHNRAVHFAVIQLVKLCKSLFCVFVRYG